MRNFVKKMWSDVVLGVLFVVSGFVKAVDLVGFSYKIEEYLGMFQLSSWREFSSVFFGVTLYLRMCGDICYCCDYGVGLRR